MAAQMNHTHTGLLLYERTVSGFILFDESALKVQSPLLLLPSSQEARLCVCTIPFVTDKLHKYRTGQCSGTMKSNLEIV